MSRTADNQEVKSTWPRTGLPGLAWTGMLVLMNVFETKLGWTKCWLITSCFFFFLPFLKIPFFASVFSSVGFQQGQVSKAGCFLQGHDFEFCFFPFGELSPGWNLDGRWGVLTPQGGMDSDHSCQCKVERCMMWWAGSWSFPAFWKMKSDSRALILTPPSSCRTLEFIKHLEHIILLEPHHLAVILGFLFSFYRWGNWASSG